MCAEYGIEQPDLVGEFGRYTAAAYGFDFYKVVVSKPSHRADVGWYVIDGSLMSSLPDSWALKQQFIVLPLNGYDRPVRKVWLSGLTCDSDDIYRSGEEDDTVVLPDIATMEDGEELVIGVFMTGAYQDLLSGIGGVHHCLLPEPSELVIEPALDGKGYTYTRSVPSQSVHAMASLLGYHKYLPYLAPHEQPAENPALLPVASAPGDLINLEGVNASPRRTGRLRVLANPSRNRKRALAPTG
jgi:arginine decarboxylase